MVRPVIKQYTKFDYKYNIHFYDLGNFIRNILRRECFNVGYNYQFIKKTLKLIKFKYAATQFSMKLFSSTENVHR